MGMVLIGVLVAGTYAYEISGPKLESMDFGGSAESLSAGTPRVLVAPLQTRGGSVTIESIRLDHPVFGLRATFALANVGCGQGFATSAITTNCELGSPDGAKVGPGNPAMLVASYELAFPTTVAAPDVIVTYHAGAARTRTTRLGLRICLSSQALTPGVCE
jgi:hypothetical protein